MQSFGSSSSQYQSFVNVWLHSFFRRRVVDSRDRTRQSVWQVPGPAHCLWRSRRVVPGRRQAALDGLDSARHVRWRHQQWCVCEQKRTREQFCRLGTLIVSRSPNVLIAVFELLHISSQLSSYAIWRRQLHYRLRQRLLGDQRLQFQGDWLCGATARQRQPGCRVDQVDHLDHQNCQWFVFCFHCFTALPLQL